VKGYDPRGVGQRVLYALALLWAISFAAHQIVIWLTPVVPLIISVSILISIWVVVFGRRRR
jgi:hypothetical protein